MEQYYRFADAFNRRDLDAVLAFLDPDVDWEPRSVALEGGRPYRGHDGFRTWWESTFTAFSDYVAEIEEVRDFGDMTVSRLRFRGHGMESDVPIDEMQWPEGGTANAPQKRPKPERPAEQGLTGAGTGAPTQTPAPRNNKTRPTPPPRGEPPPRKRV